MVQVYVNAKNEARKSVKASVKDDPEHYSEEDFFWQLVHNTVRCDFDRNVSDAELAAVLMWKPTILDMSGNDISQPKSHTVRDMILDGMIQSIYDELMEELAPAKPGPRP